MNETPKNEDQESKKDEAEQFVPAADARIPEETLQPETLPIDDPAASDGDGSSGPRPLSVTGTQQFGFSVYKKLLMGFGVLIALSLILGGVSILGLNKTIETWGFAKTYGIDMANSSEDVQIQLLQARRAEKDFLLRYKQKGIKKAKEEYIQGKQTRALDKAREDLHNIVTIAQQAGLAKEQQQAQEALTLVDEYQKGTEDVVELIEQRGHRDTGIIGEMRSSIHNLEDDVKNANRQDLTVLMLQARRDEKDFLLREDAKYVEKHSKTIDQLKTAIQVTSLDSSLTPSQKARLFQDLDIYREKFASVVNMTDQISEEINVFRAAAHALENISNKVEFSGLENQAVYLTQVEKISQTVKRIIITIILLITLIGIIVGVLIGRNLSGSISVIVEAVKSVAQSNDLTKEISVLSRDEIGSLGNMFNDMRSNLYSIVSQIQQAALKINSSSNEILATTNQQEASTKEQSTQMNEVRSTLNESVATSTELSHTAVEVTNFAKNTGEDAAEGARLIDDTNTKMTAMKDSNKTVSDRLRILNEKIEGIGKILTTILSVADQTNLLSLNAAIEAAKAGEHGKGFSVVAQEIRRLADQTAQSSKEITDLINDIQTASSSAIMVMDKSSQDVNSGTDLVNQLSGQFSKIAEKIQNMLAQVESISESINEQATGNKEIASTVDQMAEATRMTAASAVQTRQLAYDMTSLGQQLREAVTKFKLK